MKIRKQKAETGPRDYGPRTTGHEVFNKRERRERRPLRELQGAEVKGQIRANLKPETGDRRPET